LGGGGGRVKEGRSANMSAKWKKGCRKGWRGRGRGWVGG